MVHYVSVFSLLVAEYVPVGVEPVSSEPKTNTLTTTPTRPEDNSILLEPVQHRKLYNNKHQLSMQSADRLR